MTKAFIVDLDRCTGCYACEIACKDENDLAPSVRRVRVDSIEVGEFNRFYIPVFTLEKRGVEACTLCPQLQAEGRRPACVHNCLTNALFFGESSEMEEKAEKMRPERVKREHKRANVIYVSSKSIPEGLTE
jgi:Fe-S-cluster-containing dehydrogenase component